MLGKVQINLKNFGVPTNNNNHAQFQIPRLNSLGNDVVEIQNKSASKNSNFSFGAIPKSSNELGIGETFISTGNPETCKLNYRGYDIGNLLNSGYEEVSYLLLHGKLPTIEELKSFNSEISNLREIQDGLKNDIERISIKKGNIFDKLQSAVMLLKLEEPLEHTISDYYTTDLMKAKKLIAIIPTLITTIYRESKGLESIQPKTKLNSAENLLYMIKGQIPDKQDARALEQAMICMADHGFNASTLTARTVASTGSDMYSAVSAAIGAFQGPKHGGASEEVAEMLKNIDTGDISTDTYIQKNMEQGKLIPGYGHAKYKKADSRVGLLMDIVEKSGQRKENLKWYNLTRQIMDIMAKTTTKSGKILPPNADTPLAALYLTMDISPDLFSPIFASSRISGWVSHITEQHKFGKIYRPSDIYKGPLNLPYTKLLQRI